MKVLSFGVLYFKLPDDFTGGLSEALRAMADYHDEKAGTPVQKIGGPRKASDDLSAIQHEEKIWGGFWTGVHAGEFRVYGHVGIAEYPEDGSPSVGRDLNTGEPE